MTEEDIWNLVLAAIAAAATALFVWGIRQQPEPNLYAALGGATVAGLAAGIALTPRQPGKDETR